MIQLDEKEIGRLTAEEFLQHKNQCLTQLKGDQPFDLLLDCRATLLDLADLETIKNILETKGRTLVILVSKADLDRWAMDWNVVPTLQEAHDFLAFERMQRDLGF